MDLRCTEEPDRRVIEILRKYCGAKNASPSTRLSELQLDSLDLIECLFELEQYYGKTLSNRELSSLTTVRDLVEAFRKTNIQGKPNRKRQDEESIDEH